ncbi:MAG: hypothetical protein Q8916_03985 [Bacteroidota bacterium]|nr:hypothetical protein [Bacteroidota bacterium]MDP4235115.1 hypothetical protein [Bacteroidota bacterium]
MVHYEDRLSLREGLSEYFTRFNLGDGGYSSRFFKINFFWKCTLTLPNLPNRVQAVKFHDLHHVLTEYETGLRGEAEIGAWEIASGCGKFWAAWLLNLGSMTYGIVLYPKAVFKAFIRGRYSGNLYHGKVYEQVLESPIREMRNELHLDGSERSARISDVLLYVFWIFLILSVIAGELFLGVSLLRLLF